MWKFFGRVVKTFFHISEQDLNRKLLFEEKLQVRYFSSSFGSKVCSKIVKIAVFNSRGIVLEKAFVWKKTIGSKMFFGLRKESFRQDCQNCILLYQRNNVGELFFGENHCIFFRASVEKFSEWLSKSPSDFPDEHFAISVCLKELTFSNFFRSSGEKFLAGLSKLHYIFSDDFLRKLLFEKTIASRNFFRLRWESFRQNCGYYTLLFQRNILGENFCFEKKY